MTDSERNRLDDLKARLWGHVSPPGLRNEDEERLAEALDALDARDAEIARLQGVLDEMSEAWPEHRVDCVEPRDEGERILQHFARKARTALKGGSHD
jgi:hypothetical protein